MSTDPVVILSYARTPMGGMQGALADVAATDLGATAVKAAVERAGIDGADIERIYMGNVLPAGLGQAPARQAAIKADKKLTDMALVKYSRLSVQPVTRTSGRWSARWAGSEPADHPMRSMIGLMRSRVPSGIGTRRSSVDVLWIE